jgi:YggT family protein
MRAILDIVLVALDLYKFVIIAGAILSWLIAFNVVNIRNEFVRSVWNLFLALTEPLLRPIRRFLPNTGGVDISPIILLLGVMLIERIVVYYVYPYVF